MASITRNPAVAGQFYPASAPALKKEVEKYLISGGEKIKAIGIVSPHAGYIYSGPVAGATLSAVELEDTCVIIGPNHTGQGAPFSIMTEGVWRMPSGDCRIDEELARSILGNSGYLREDILAHRNEHSIEVQLPFMQALRDNLKIVPMVLSDAKIEVYREIGKGIAKSLIEKKTATIIASSDMTHYESQEAANKKDKMAIEAILRLDEDELMRTIIKRGISMCGYAPVCVMLSAAKECGARNAKLIKYQTSGDVTGDYGAVVGYAGIVVY
ncbi:MAG: AmmeMemoRadiSam system protein B [Candidatus Omnitrophota bacterium]